MAKPAYLYDVPIPKTASQAKRNYPPAQNPKANNESINSNNDEANDFAVQRQMISTPVSVVSKAPSMFMESHRKSLYMKDYSKKKSIPNAIYNSNHREKVTTNHPLDSLTMNKACF